MPSFMGHAAPGTFALGLGSWWTINIFKQLFASRGRNRTPFRSQPWYPGPFGVKFPVESVLKIVVAACGASSEIVAIFQAANGHLFGINGHHVTMYVFVVLNGAMDLLMYVGFPLPEGIEAASGVLALAVEGFLLASHVHDGRSDLEVQVHKLLLFAILGAVLSIFLEIFLRDSAVPALARAYFTLLQGTWFWHVGFIVCPKLFGMRGWDEHEHHTMWPNLLFVWHMAGVFVFMLLLGAVVWGRGGRCHRFDDVGYHVIPVTPDGKKDDGKGLEDTC